MNGLEAYVIGAIVVIFNAGGVFYLAKNHFAHVNDKLDKILNRQGRAEQRIARIEGVLSIPADLTEE